MSILHGNHGLIVAGAAFTCWLAALVVTGSRKNRKGETLKTSERNLLVVAGTDNLAPLGESGNTARLHLEAGGPVVPSAQASVAVNSLGLLDLVQIAAEGLAPKSQYRGYLAESDHAPFGTLEALAVLKTNPDGVGIVQAIGPLKAIVHGDSRAAAAQSGRFLIITYMNDPSQVVLRQADAATVR